MAYTVKIGKHKLGVEFEDGYATVTLGGVSVGANEPTPQGIADAARYAVSARTAAEQIAINQQRVIEDARRILGS